MFHKFHHLQPPTADVIISSNGLMDLDWIGLDWLDVNSQSAVNRRRGPETNKCTLPALPKRGAVHVTSYCMILILLLY